MAALGLLLLAGLSTLTLVSAYPTNSSQLWPLPQSASFGTAALLIDESAFRITEILPPNVNSDIILQAIKRYMALFFPFTASEYKGKPRAEKKHYSGTLATLSIEVDSNSEGLQFGVDESYSLTVNTNGSSVIHSATVFGALRALETFSQLVLWDPLDKIYFVSNVPAVITDVPRFPWRGIMIDTARHYLPVAGILHTIDALAYNKFNTLHWHTVDAESFPIESASFPQLAEEGAYSPDATYSAADIQEIVQYGLYRGIRVVPEFDIPGHAASWGQAFPNLTVYCADYMANRKKRDEGEGSMGARPHPLAVNNIPLDPTSNFTYHVVSGFLADMAQLFPDKFLHTGGDEVVFGCWTENAAVTKWMAANGFSTPQQLEGYFEQRLHTTVAGLNRTMLVWQDVFQNGNVPSNDTIVEVWESSATLQTVISAGYRGLLAAPYYLNKQEPTGNTHYEWVDTWQDFYTSDPTAGLTGNTALVVGGEGCMWGEQVDGTNFDSRVWPRASGIGERLWSPASVNNLPDAINRLMSFRCRLAQRNIGAGPIAPDYCPLPNQSTFVRRA